MSASVEFRGLSRRYGGFVALDDVELQVAAGEFVTLLGPSGSGKSTILKLLAGFDRPTAGDILIDGASVVDVPPHRRGIGMVFQNYALFPHMTVFENIAFPLRARDVADAQVEEKVRGALAMIRLESFAARFPRELSGGQQQRVALARAIVFGPRVLLMDEPLAALDRHLREQLKFEIKQIQRDLQMTVLFVTHDQDEALVMSDRIVVMREGRIEQVASPYDLYARPGNRFVANFVGQSNILACTARDGQLYLGDVPLGLAHRVPASLLIRPEQVRIVETGGHPATIESVTFLGEASRIVVTIGADRLVVRQQDLVPGSYQPGQAVRITFDPARAVVLAD